MPITILIVDDEEIVRKLVRIALKGCVDANFLEAKDAVEGLKIARQHPGPIDLLVSDVVMPGRMNGAEMAGVLTEARPETKVFLMSGYFPEMATMKPDWYFVQKPFSATDIREGVRNIVAENCLAAAV